MWFEWLIIAVMLSLSFFFSSAEVVYGSLNKLRLKKKVEQRPTFTIKNAYKLTNNYPTTVATVIFGNALSNVAISALVASITARIDPNMAAVSGLLVFLVLLVFFEIIPKTISLRYANGLALVYAFPMIVFYYLFFPIVYLDSKLVGAFASIFTKRTKKLNQEDTTDEELQVLVEEIEKSGEIDEAKGELLHSAIDFSETVAYEIMTPRVDIFAFDINDSLEELLGSKEIFNYSRIPVYDDTIDNIIGILPTKKLVRAVLKHELIDLRALLITPIYVHRSRSLYSILEEFKKTSQHLAIVKDEYGGTDGILTLEDIVEEIVGDIWDETDEVEEPFEERGPGVYVIDGMMNIDDFFDLLDIDEEVDTEYATVGGWCLEQLDRFAHKGDQFVFADRAISILEATDFTVEKIEVRKLLAEEKEALISEQKEKNID